MDGGRAERPGLAERMLVSGIADLRACKRAVVKRIAACGTATVARSG